MQTSVPLTQSGRKNCRAKTGSPARIALDENELAIRWGLSVKTLRRWRQEQLGPIYCKLGRRVMYLQHEDLQHEVEAFEKRVSRYSSFTRAYV